MVIGASMTAVTVLLTGEQIVRLVEVVPGILMAAASLAVALRAWRTADAARDAARDAHQRAAEAVREQVNFALRHSNGDVPAQAAGRATVEERKGENG